MLELSNVNVYYGGIHALKDVSIKIEEGEVVTLIGANGAGKSTALKAISGMEKPKSGEIKFNGEKINFLNATDTVK